MILIICCLYSLYVNKNFVEYDEKEYKYYSFFQKKKSVFLINLNEERLSQLLFSLIFLNKYFTKHLFPNFLYFLHHVFNKVKINKLKKNNY